MKTVWRNLDEAKRRGDRILFEGAQGAMLDVDYGTCPYVTSSNTVAGQAATGSGIGVGALSYVLGITKAYTTRVGSGPFPSEITDKIGQTLVCSAITCNENLRRRLIDAVHIDRLNLGPVPTTKLNWLQPHEGNIVDFLFRARAFQSAPLA